MNKKKDFMNRRRQMFIFGLLGLVCLSMWTLSAFWAHIRALQSDFQYMAFAGAVFGELILVDLLWCYCFNKSLKVRREAIIYEFLLIVILAGHAGILRGMHSIEQRQLTTETRLKDSLNEMSKEQMAAIKGADETELNPRTRRAANAEAEKTRRAIAENAQKQVGEAIKAHDENVIEQTLAPKWYINGWMYAVIFLVSALLAARVKWLHAHVAPEDLDEDFDGVADVYQRDMATEAADAFHAARVSAREPSGVFAERDRNHAHSRVATPERVHFENPQNKTTRVATHTTLEDHLRHIAESYPGFHFKVGRKQDGVLIRLYSKDRGRDVFEYGRKYPLELLQNVDEPGFCNQLESALARDGFVFEKKGRE